MKWSVYLSPIWSDCQYNFDIIMIFFLSSEMILCMYEKLVTMDLRISLSSKSLVNLSFSQRLWEFLHLKKEFPYFYGFFSLFFFYCNNKNKFHSFKENKNLVLSVKDIYLRINTFWRIYKIIFLVENKEIRKIQKLYWQSACFFFSEVAVNLINKKQKQKNDFLPQRNLENVLSMLYLKILL